MDSVGFCYVYLKLVVRAESGLFGFRKREKCINIAVRRSVEREIISILNEHTHNGIPPDG